MKKLALFLALVACSSACFAQVGNLPVNTQFQGVPVGPCQPYSIAENALTGDQYNCLNYVWTKIATGGGGAISGSGTLGKLTIWTGASSLGNSNESEVAGVFTIGIPASITLNYTANATVPVAITTQVTYAPTGNFARGFSGGIFEADLAGTHDNSQIQSGVRGTASNTGTGTLGTGIGVWGRFVDTSGTTTTGTGVEADLTMKNGTNGYGVYVPAPTISGTVTNQYGIYLGDWSTGSTNNWALKINGGLAEFGGPVVNDPKTLTSSGGTTAIDLSLGNVFQAALTESTTCSFTNFKAGQSVTFIVTQNAGSAYTFTCGTTQHAVGFMTVSAVLSTIDIQTCTVSSHATDMYCNPGSVGLLGGTP